jgi:hypothetical protein
MLLLLWRSHSPKQRWLGPQAPPPQMVLPASANVIPAIIMETILGRQYDFSMLSRSR